MQFRVEIGPSEAQNRQFLSEIREIEFLEVVDLPIQCQLSVANHGVVKLLAVL